MRNLLLIALVALGATFQGEVRAEIPSTQIVTVDNGSGEMDPALVSAILVQVSELTNYSVNDLRWKYETGMLTISPSSGDYQVSILTEAEGILDILLDDF